MRAGKARALLLCIALAAPGACGKRSSGSGQEPAPASSVITLGAALGTCEDVALCAKECDAGSADRCRRLAATYALGQGADKDEARATDLYVKGCSLNDAPACVFAGQMHEYAHGVPKDDARAARFYERACDLGWAPGCYNLGIMLEHGRGVLQDRARAGDMYQVACTAGSKTACDRAKAMHEPSP